LLLFYDDDKVDAAAAGDHFGVENGSILIILGCCHNGITNSTIGSKTTHYH
jgi:metal-dependent hydrolase (beta-lactamase superfamily II)